MSQYIAWLDGSDDDGTQSHDDSDMEELSHYLYDNKQKRQQATATATAAAVVGNDNDGDGDDKVEHNNDGLELDDDDIYYDDYDDYDDYEENDGDENDGDSQAPSRGLPSMIKIKNKNDPSQKKKKKKKKKKQGNNTNANNSANDNSNGSAATANIQYVDEENDEFFVRMKHEEMERVRKVYEQNRDRAKNVKHVDFCASFLQCFKMSFSREPVKVDSQMMQYQMPHAHQQNVTLRRFGHSMCHYGNDLFLVGGSSEHHKFSDLLVYNLEQRSWRNVRVEDQRGRQLKIPPYAFLFTIGNSLVIYTTRNSFYLLDEFAKLRTHNTVNYHYLVGVDRSTRNNGQQYHWRYGYPTAVTPANTTTSDIMTQDYCATTVGTTLYVFGGSVDGFSTNILQKFSFSIQRSIMEIEKEIVDKKQTFGVPPPRSKHGCAVVNSNIYVFGGLCERREASFVSQNKKLVYNDLYVYDTDKALWTEIEVNGVSPPPLYGFTMTAVNHFIYIYGGFNEHDEIQSHIYRFDTKNLTWSVILVRGASWPSTSSPTDYQLPCALHGAVEIGGNRIAIIGGMHDTEKQKKVVHPNNFTIMNEMTDEGTGKQLIDYLWSCVDRNLYTDLILRCTDRGDTNDKTDITVHRAMLAARSSFFAQVLQEFEPMEYSEDGVGIFEVADFFTDTVQSYIRFLYKGELKVSGADQVLDILKCSEQWGHYEEIATICNGGVRFLDLSARIMTDLTNDFKRLFLESFEEFDLDNTPDLFQFDVLPNKSDHGMKKYTDACVQLLNEDDEVFLKLTGHKLFLSRSQHIFNAFNSGMEESYTGNIQFNGLSRDGLLGVLRFLYTDEIDINPEIAIEVLLASHMFNLPILASYCCKVIMENVDKSNVLQILDIADTYNNGELKRKCIAYFMKHHVELSRDESFAFLSDDVKKLLLNDLVPQRMKNEMRRKRRELLRLKNKTKNAR